MQIALINPPKTFQVWAGVPDIFNMPDAYLFPPLGIMYLAGFLKQRTRHVPFLFDAVAQAWSAEQVAAQAIATGASVLGVTANTHNLVNVAEVIAEARRLQPNITVLLGGSHVNSFPEEAARLPGVDVVIRGDGEETLANFLDCLESGKDWKQLDNLAYLENGQPRLTTLREPDSDLDLCPFPDREGLASDAYYTPGMKMAKATTIISSRGCPFNCAFCSVPHRYRTRSPKNIVDELEYCNRKLGIQEFHFIDDIFNITTDRVMAISQEILNRNLKIFWGFKAGCKAVNENMLSLARKAGCIRMHYGVETWSDEGLISMNKQTRLADIKPAFAMTRKAGIRPIAYLIIGCPHEKTPADVLKVVPFVKSLNPDYVVFSLYTPYPDAPIFKEGVAKGLWDADCWKKFMRNPTRTYELPTVWNEFMTKEQLVELLKRVHNGFYFSPGVMLRTLASMRTLPELIRLIQGGMILLKLQILKSNTRRI